MNVMVAEHIGFCFGVMRALNIAKKTKEGTDKPVFTLGPLIHNPQAVHELEELGIHPINSLDEAHGGILIIRSHGVPPDVIEKAKEKGFEIVDATCPFVKRVQEYARKLCEEGYRVIVVGEENHPEVIGIIGHTGGKAEAMNKRRIPVIEDRDRIGMVAQTTQSIENLKLAISYVVERVKELKVYNTICNATYMRQQSTKLLAKEVDLMLVVGGKMSANTSRLVEIARNEGCETYHIETKEDIDPTWFSGKITVGVASGTSTPDWVIKDVVEYIKNL